MKRVPHESFYIHCRFTDKESWQFADLWLQLHYFRYLDLAAAVDL
jgi:hypothetical protein